MTLKFTEEGLRNPSDSALVFTSLEPYFDCMGWCFGGFTELGPDGKPCALNPHFHLVVRGEQPEAAPRHYGIFS